VKPGHFKKFLHLLTDRYRSATSGHHLHIEQVQQTATCIFGFSWNRASGNALKKTRSNRIKHTNHIKPLKVGTGTEPARNRHGTGSEPAPQTVSFTGVADFVLQHPTEITQFESWAHFYMFLLLIFADFCQNFPIYQIFDTFVLLTFFCYLFLSPFGVPFGCPWRRNGHWRWIPMPPIRRRWRCSSCFQIPSFVQSGCGE